MTKRLLEFRGHLFVAGLTMLAAVASGCGQSERPADDFVPARDLSLADLVRHGPPPPENIAVESPVPALFNDLERQVASGERTRLEADRLLATALRGEVDRLPPEYAGDTADLSIPDRALAWLERRAASYPDDVRDEIYASSELIGPLPTPRLAMLGIGAGVPGGPPLTAVQCQFPPCRDEGIVHVEFGRANQFASYPDSIEGAPWTTIAEAINRALSVYPAFLETPPPASIVIYAVGSQGALIDSDESPIPPGSNPAARMKTCQDIRIMWTRLFGGDPTREVVVHELFHCLHMESQRQAGQPGLELWQEDAGTEPPAWVTEGMAVWAEELAYPDLNSPWRQYQQYAVAPQRSLGQLAHDAGLFMRFLEQYNGVGSLKLILDTYLPSGPKDLPPVSSPAGFPNSWLDFVDATTGYATLYEQEGRFRMSESPPDFPYESAGNFEGTFTVGQDSHRLPTPLAGGSIERLEVPIPPASALHKIWNVSVTDDAYLDVGMTSELSQAVDSRSDDLRISALLTHDFGETLQDWSKLWRDRRDEAPDIVTEDGNTDGSFRVCLRRLGYECSEADDVFYGLTEIRLFVANAGLDDSKNLSGELVLFPHAIEGYLAEEFEFGTPDEEGQQ